MNKKSFYIIGVMSGTSLDGVDLVYVRFNSESYKDFEILHSETTSYSQEWKQNLEKAVSFSETKLAKLNLEYGFYLGEKINNFINQFKIERVDFIASHGHTVLHQPEKGITLQIGDGATITEKTGLKVVCDFRTQDVRMGGQGAPLVPIGDELLFADSQFCLNLGGFSNVSFHKNGQRIAFDICPVNIVMNLYAEKLGVPYDNGGEIAAGGNIHVELLNHLNGLEFYQKVPPKSLGLEWVQQNVFPFIDDLEINISDVLRTFVEHCAMQIGNVLKGSDSILATGGGVFNAFLMKRIEHYVGREILLPSKGLINYKEALVFAFLGLLKIEGKVNCLKSVTGARENHSSGEIFYP